MRPRVRPDLRVDIHVYRKAPRNGCDDLLVDIKPKPNVGIALDDAGRITGIAGCRCEILVNGVKRFRVWRDSRKRVWVSKPNSKSVPFTRVAKLIVEGKLDVATKHNRKRDTV